MKNVLNESNLFQKHFNMKISIWQTNWIYEAYPDYIQSNKTIVKWIEVDDNDAWNIINYTQEQIIDLINNHNKNGSI